MAGVLVTEAVNVTPASQGKTVLSVCPKQIYMEINVMQGASMV
jgi:hypothetical protein